MNKYRRLFAIVLGVIIFHLGNNLDLLKNPYLNSLNIVQAKNILHSTWKQKEFIITMWNASEPSSSHYSQIAKENYNVIPVNYNAQPLHDVIERLDTAKKNGFKIILGDELINPASFRDPIKKKKLDNLIEKVKGHISLEGYFITDEPVASNFSNYVELVSYLRKQNPGKLIYFNIPATFVVKVQPDISLSQLKRKNISYPSHLNGVSLDNKTVMSYLSYLREFTDIIKPDLISYDHYQFFGNSESTEYFLNLALIHQVSEEIKKPFLNIIQASRYLKVWRLPNVKEMRFQVYTTIAYGGRGISYFIYWGNEEEEGLYRNGRQSALANEIALINSEIRAVGKILMPLDLRGVYHTDPLPFGGEGIPKKALIKILSKSELVIGLFGKGKKTNVFLIANRSYKQKQEVDISVNIPVGKIQELNRTTGKWKTTENLSNRHHRFHLTLEPGDGRLFRIL
jgi:hypothetical protein